MFNNENHCRPTRTRREFIQDAFCGFGSLALASILHQQQLRADDGLINPLAPKLATPEMNLVDSFFELTV